MYVGHIGALVFSHWVLDWISHPMGMGKTLPPDLPLPFEGSPKVGLGLYNSLWAGAITELGLFAAGIVVYLISTRSQSRTRTMWEFWLMVLVIVLIVIPGTIRELSLLPTFLTLLLWPIGNWVDLRRAMRVAVAPGVT